MRRAVSSKGRGRHPSFSQASVLSYRLTADMKRALARGRRASVRVRKAIASERICGEYTGCRRQTDGRGRHPACPCQLTKNFFPGQIMRRQYKPVTGLAVLHGPHHPVRHIQHIDNARNACRKHNASVCGESDPRYVGCSPLYDPDRK